jgi:hypothetical protein
MWTSWDKAVDFEGDFISPGVAFVEKHGANYFLKRPVLAKN